MYTSEIERPGREVASTDNGKIVAIKNKYHCVLFLKKKNGVWKQLN
jgi:hypothetical protein